MADRALLLTDLVDSTLLTERLGDAEMARLVGEYERVARDLLRRFGGREIDKADGFLLLFEQATDAARYAIAYHAALATLGLAARAGLHVGAVVLRENKPEDVALGAKPIEVEGLTKSIAGRILAIAMKRQTLLSAEAAAALGAADLGVVSHGCWRMKGLQHPIELFEIGGEYAPFTPPPDSEKSYRVVLRDTVWTPVRDVPHRLPAEHDRFVGREADLLELARRFDEGARLITVVGAGGTGKTRLATRFARTWLGDWSGGAWFCDLANARDSADIVAAVARTLDVTLDATDPVAKMGHAIAGRDSCLVILDNFEQVAALARETVGAWLDRAPHARFLVTSRELLGLPGEVVLDLETLAAGVAIELFVTRAGAANRRFSTAPTERPLLETLVRMLDGLPLAIELAAARAGMLSTQQIHDRMRDRFQLLASTHGRGDRHATLRAAIDSSWELLSASEQSALAQLSVFEGGFTVEAADTVLALPPGSTNLAAIQALVDKSLVRRVSDERLGLLVSIQDYAGEKLRAAGGTAVVDAQIRHGVYFGAFGTEKALNQLMSRGALRWRMLASELGNVVSACNQSVTRADTTTAFPLLAAAQEVYELVGPCSQAVELAEMVCAMGSLLSADEQAVAATQAGRARFHNGEPEAARIHLVGALSNPQCDRRTAGRARHYLGQVCHQQGRMEEARGLYDMALAESHATRDEFYESRCHALIGAIDHQQGRTSAAREHFEANLELSRARGDRRAEGGALSNLAMLIDDDLDARRLNDLALEAHREVGNRQWEAVSLNNLAGLCQKEGLLPEAEIHLRQALALGRQGGNPRTEALALSNLGDVLRHLRRPSEANLAIRRAIDILRLAEDRYQLIWALAALAEVAVDLGDVSAARAAAGEAERIAAQIGMGPESRLQRAVAAARAVLEVVGEPA